jgi:serine/threonine protein kinase
LILAQITSPYVIEYYDSFFDDENLYIIMEYAEKGTLNEFIKKKKELNELIPEIDIWRYLLELCIGVYRFFFYLDEISNK